MDPSDRRGRQRDATLKALLVSAAVVLAALTLGLTRVSERAERREAQSHAEADVANLALAMQWQIDRQLVSVDQAMRRLAARRGADPAGFASGELRTLQPLGSEGSVEIYILDVRGVVVAGPRRELVGTSMADNRAFVAARDADGAGLLISPVIHWKAGGWRIELSRRIEASDGGFNGAVVASYDPWSMTNMLDQVDLGPRGLVALVGDDGSIRALVSPYDVRPGQDIINSAMFRATRQLPLGVWTGASAPDGVVRVHAFRRLADEDLTIVIGIDRVVALRDAALWSTTARWIALGMLLAILIVAGLSWREITATRRRITQAAADQRRLEQAYRHTERAKAEAERKTAQIEGVLAGMSDGVMLLDDELRLALWNERFPLYTGVPAELLRVGLPMQEMLRAQGERGEFGPLGSCADIEREVQRRMGALQSGRVSGRLERIRPSGRSIELRRSLLPGGGYVTLYTDTTARRQTELAQAEARRIGSEAAEQKAGFVAVVSHEIRTPLNAVLGSLVLLDQYGLSPAQRRHADTAREAGDALLHLVNDVLDMASMESGRLELRPVKFDLRQLLGGVEAMFRAEAERRALRLMIDVASELPHRLHADSGRLRQVLMNFVGNAVKFSAPGIVTIRARTAMVEGRESLRLSVCDPGPRIVAAQAALLFRPFSRLGEADRSGAPGTGLGLAICAGLVRLMGGQVGVASAGQDGNEFWLALPLQQMTVPGNAEPHQPGFGVAEATVRLVAPTLRRLARLTVLLVEDVPANQRVIATLLRRAGHRVDVADSGAEAVRMAVLRPYNLVFMDLSMPGISGFEAATAIRALPGIAGNVPIVALTATTAPDDCARCKAAGIDAVLSKPASLEDLRGMMLRFGSVRHAQAEQPGALFVLRAEPPPDEQLDMERVAELRSQFAPETMAELVGRCFADVRERQDALGGWLQAGNLAQAGAAAHAISGIALTFGMSGVTQRTRSIMALLREGDLEAARAMVGGLDAELAAATVMLNAVLVPQGTDA